MSLRTILYCGAFTGVVTAGLSFVDKHNYDRAVNNRLVCAAAGPQDNTLAETAARISPPVVQTPTFWYRGSGNLTNGVVLASGGSLPVEPISGPQVTSGLLGLNKTVKTDIACYDPLNPDGQKRYQLGAGFGGE